MAQATQIKPIQFWAPKHDEYQFFFKERKAELFHTAGGHERFRRHENSVAKFKPLGPGSGGFYETSDQTEIEDLRTCTDLVEVK